MHANLFGDFVKGKNLDYLSESVKRGVVLHRSIDSYIDTHPDVKLLMGKLSPELPKVSGIAIDLYFDHFLSVHWDKFHEKPLLLYLKDFTP